MKQLSFDEPTVIQEEIDPQLIESLFRNYANGTDALLEIIDNSVDENLHGRRLQIDVTVSSKAIKVIDLGGAGMDLAKLRAFFVWGRSSKAGREGVLGRYGQGGKAALGYLGKSFTLTAKAAGEDLGYRMVEHDWRSRSAGTKSWVVSRVEAPCEPAQGYVEIEIRNLSGRKIYPDILKDKLGDTYRELVRDGKCEIRVNREVVPPLELPLYERYTPKEVRHDLRPGWRVTGWYGRLRADTSKTGRLKGGIRCTVHGRLVASREFFGHPGPQQKQSLNQLIGVIELPFAPVNMNKTDFDRDSSEWQAVEKFMYDEIAPLIKELRGAQELDKVSDNDRKRVREARELFDKALQRMQWKELLQAKFQTASGQRPKRDEVLSAETLRTSVDRKERSDKGGSHKPATAPPSNSEGTRRRLGPLPWQAKVLGERTRSMIGTESGSPTIFINTKYPLYKLTKGELWYVVETGALEHARYERETGLSVSDYLTEVNDLLAQAFDTEP